jgi:serine/threonine-protein kinase
VKVLDFGLARALDAGEVATASDLSQSPTITQRMTQAGTILGTAAYMAPEQARGREVDRRADIWAFGALFYEMLTGKRGFTGETISETLAAVMRDEPD